MSSSADPSLQQYVREWVRLDTQCRRLQEELSVYRNTKRELADRIYDEVKHFPSTPVIEISDGRLSFADTKTYTSLTFSFLHDCFLKHYEGDEGKAAEMVHFIKSCRECTVEKELKRVIVNGNH